MGVVVPTSGYAFSSAIPQIGLGSFDMEACYTNLQNECIQAETSAYWTASYIYLFFLFIALFSNLFVISLYLRGHQEFKKVCIFSDIMRRFLDGLLLANLPVTGGQLALLHRTVN